MKQTRLEKRPAADGGWSASALVKMALCVAALCVASWLALPLPFTPVRLTAQSLVVAVIGFVLPPRQAAYTLESYLFMGLLGLPVFAGGTGQLVGPAGGFYLGFLAAAVCISWLKGRRSDRRRYLLVAVGVGVPVQHILGVLVFWKYTGVPLRTALWGASIPFLPGDVAKAAAAAMIGYALNRALPGKSGDERG